MIYLIFQVLLRGGTTYWDILKDEEARREEDLDIDIEVSNNYTKLYC